MVSRVLVPFPADGSNDSCEKCNKIGDLLSCSFCNLVFHNKIDCLPQDYVLSASLLASPYFSFSCPDCFLEAVKRHRAVSPLLRQHVGVGAKRKVAGDGRVGAASNRGRSNKQPSGGLDRRPLQGPLVPACPLSAANRDARILSASGCAFAGDCLVAENSALERRPCSLCAISVHHMCSTGHAMLSVWLGDVSEVFCVFLSLLRLLF